MLVIRDGQKATVYHVHKATLVYGERRSGYFVNLFEKMYNKGKSTKRNVTEIPVDSYTSRFVPLMLDYIYADKLELDAEVAPGLRRLANQFDVRQLYALVSSFIQQDLSEKTVATYVEQSEFVQDKELNEVATLMAIQVFDLIPKDDLGKIPPSQFQDMLSNQDLNVPSPERLSERIADYIRGRKEDLDEESFFFLTHENIMPKIHPNEALWFLSYGSRHFPSVIKDESNGGYEGSLQHRCVLVLSKSWESLLLGPINKDINRKKERGDDPDGSPTKRRLFANESDTDDLGDVYMELPDDVKIEILQQSLLQASLERNRGTGRNSIVNRADTVTSTSPKEQRGERGGIRQALEHRRVW